MVADFDSRFIYLFIISYDSVQGKQDTELSCAKV